MTAIRLMVAMDTGASFLLNMVLNQDCIFAASKRLLVLNTIYPSEI